MITPYLVTYEFYYDGELMSRRSITSLLESHIDAEYSGSDFESLWNFMDGWAGLIPFNRYNFKFGIRFIQHYDALLSLITKKNCKSWKFVVSSTETTISMKELMSYNAETVIQYLKERGITTCPIMK